MGHGLHQRTPSFRRKCAARQGLPMAPSNRSWGKEVKPRRSVTNRDLQVEVQSA